jgi:ParB-like chromosome segregation protein Spo0J
VGRLFGGRRTDLQTRLVAIVRQLEGYEKKLGDISRAHTLAELETRNRLTELHERLAHLEEVNRAQREQIEALQAQHADRMGRIRSTVADQREALTGLETTLESEPPPQGERGSLPTEASP